MRRSQLREVLAHVEEGEVWAASSVLVLPFTSVHDGRKNPTEQTPNGLIAGNLSINTRSHLVHVNGELVPLRPTAFRILVMLAESEGSVIERDFNLSLWGGHTAVHTLDVHIGVLRAALEGTGCDRRVSLVRRVGFRLDPVV